MESASQAMAERRLSNLEGLERFERWFESAHYGAKNWRQLPQFQPYSPSIALEYSSGAYINDALSALEIYGYNTSNLRLPAGRIELNKLPHADRQLLTKAQDVALLYQYGKITEHAICQNGAPPSFTVTKANDDHDVQVAHVMQKILAPEFRQLFQEKVDSLAQHLQLKLHENKAGQTFAQRVSRSGVPLVPLSR